MNYLQERKYLIKFEHMFKNGDFRNVDFKQVKEDAMKEMFNRYWKDLQGDYQPEKSNRWVIINFHHAEYRRVCAKVAIEKLTNYPAEWDV